MVNLTEFRSLLENKLNKEFLTKRQDKQESESQPISLACLAGDASLARNNFRFSDENEHSSVCQ